MSQVDTHQDTVDDFDTPPSSPKRKRIFGQNLFQRSHSLGISLPVQPSWIKRSVQCRWVWINQKFRSVRHVEKPKTYPDTQYQPCNMEDPGEDKVRNVSNVVLVLIV